MLASTPCPLGAGGGGRRPVHWAGVDPRRRRRPNFHQSSRFGEGKPPAESHSSADPHRRTDEIKCSDPMPRELLLRYRCAFSAPKKQETPVSQKRTAHNGKLDDINNQELLHKRSGKCVYYIGGKRYNAGNFEIKPLAITAQPRQLFNPRCSIQNTQSREFARLRKIYY